MSDWVLLLFMSLGANSGAHIEQVHFPTQSLCMQAGQAAAKEVNGFMSPLRFVCVKRSG